MDTKFKIEKNVPAPEGSGVGRPQKYPLRQLKVGESFSFPQTLYPNVRAAAWSCSTKYKLQFVSRKQPDGTCRIWRIA